MPGTEPNVEIAWRHEDARLPGEKREVFLSRMLLSVLYRLCQGPQGGDFDALRKTLEEDHLTHVRKGRARPGGYV